MYKRSQLIEQANKKGYDIKNNDISWLIDMKLIHPNQFTKATFIYNDEDLAWVELLGELKSMGLEKSVVEKIFNTNTLQIVVQMIERMTFYNTFNKERPYDK